MPTILGDVGGFTPIIDVLVNEFGLVGASVFGRVWRYCQGERGVCQARIDTVADGLGVSGRTIQRHLRALCIAGYLEDTTPNLRNRPHTYRDTGKVMIAVKITVTESHPAVTESQTESDRESPHSDRKSPCRDRESIEDTSKETSKETIKKQVKRGLPPQAQVFVDNGGRFHSGKLKGGQTKKKRAIALMVEKVPDTPAALASWAEVVDGYCAQWSSYSYTIMVNEYYLQGRVPGRTNSRSPQAPSGPDYDAEVDPVTGVY